MKIKKIIKAIIICFILNLTIILSTKLTNVNAAISLDLQNSYFTESDSFTYLNSTYTIFDYKNSIETQGGLFASNVELLENYSQWNVFGDDPIIKIIPKEYFHTLGRNMDILFKQLMKFATVVTKMKILETIDRI